MIRIRWGLIGCGDVARKRVAQAIMDEPLNELVAACRRNQAKLQEFCDTFGIERAYTSVDALLADAEIDAVYIATPTCQHKPQTVAAAQAGEHVLVEKPMAMTVAQCDEMIGACWAARVKLGVDYYRRFYPMVHWIQELLKIGAIGKPLSVSAVTATQPGEEGYWRVIPDAGGGGALMDIGSHRINVHRPPCCASCDPTVRRDFSIGPDRGKLRWGTGKNRNFPQPDFSPVWSDRRGHPRIQSTALRYGAQLSAGSKFATLSRQTAPAPVATDTLMADSEALLAQFTAPVGRERLDTIRDAIQA